MGEIRVGARQNFVRGVKSWRLLSLWVGASVFVERRSGDGDEHVIAVGKWVSSLCPLG